MPQLWNVPNLLSLSRLPLAVAVCLCISFGWWPAGLLTFCVAAFTDWLDGWWARRFRSLTPLGRSLDPLTDKVLIGAVFIFLIPVGGPGFDPGVTPWVAAVVIARELLVTGLRGMVEATGQKFGADWFGKLKTGFQCAVLIGALLLKSLEALEQSGAWVAFLTHVYTVLFWVMLAATVGSAVQYTWKAAKLLSPPTPAE